MAEASSAPAPAGKVEPYIPASKVLPELTIGVLILGSLLSVILAGANAYLGMFAGMTVSASVPAAVISMGIFRALRTGNILQNNGVQTAAASGEGLAAGVIFTLPALIILGTWARFSYVETTLIAGFGGILGVLFTIPLRRALIIDQPLQFPEGVATAEVLKVGAEGGGGVGVLVFAGLLGAVAKLGATGFKLWAEIVEFAGYVGGGATGVKGTAAATKAGAPAYFGINASPALLSVGYIVGFNVALVIFAGAALNRWVAMPLFASYGDPASIVLNPDVHAAAMQLDFSLVSREAAALVGTLLEALKDQSWVTDTLNLIDPWQFTNHGAIAGDPFVRAVALSGELPDIPAKDAAALYHGRVTRYLGVGGMLVGGLWSLFKLRKSLLGGITAGLEAYKRARAGGADAVPRTERDMPMNIILILIGASVVPLFFIFWHFTDSPGISAVMAVVMVIAGFLFSAVASYMAGLVGSSNNPVSGITISTILVSALLLLGLGLDSVAGPVAAILIGGVVCCAAAIGGDNLQDLKCGQLVGSTPWKQQVMQILGVVVAALAMAPILNVLNDAYGIGSAGLPAPQANLMGTVAKGVFAGGLPWNIIGIGAGIAVCVIIIDVILTAKGSKFRTPVMAFSVGVYLPFDLNVPIMLGGIVALLVERYLQRTKATPERRGEVERMGLLAAAGFITGEALLGIALAVPVAALHDDKAVALFGGRFEAVKWPALLFVGLVLVLLYKLALRPEPHGKAPAPGRITK
ncbi:MAG TPA: oligopeptide transporter, OPT family [Kofleriaceae bacterium]|nr:oligopeptide transporter, OPT family [Kofleriaceae bacterium]